MLKNFLFLLAFLIAIPLSFTPSAHAQSDESILDDPHYDPSHPYYQSLRPTWAFGLRAAFSKFPVKGALGNTYQIYGEYLIPYQDFGILSFGPHVGSFPIYVPDAGIPTDQFQNAVAGAALRYQLKFMTNQWVVPMAALEWEYYRIKESLGNDNVFTGSNFGLSAGILINLGILDEVTSRDAYQSIGLLRTYFSAELRSVNINNSLFSLTGNYWLFGLRMEIE